ncbi:MAG: RNA polymerase subunit sigma [Marinilabiliales bacterium]|nr:MAG: RNA polymerase subunit sigma [Marinilabiliales bacterium]
MQDSIESAIDIILKSKFAIVFTGAGISVESGIPPFRGEKGLWNKYDPDALDLNNFHLNPFDAWKVIKEIFYDFFQDSKPNDAHLVIAELEQLGIIKAVITQNIDNLHYEAGSKVVYEFHGNSRKLVCPYCGKKVLAAEIDLSNVPLCESCHAVLKPDFIFFGEGIPEDAYRNSVNVSQNADLVIIIGSTGEVVPAASMPQLAKQYGAKIIEVNPEKTLFTDSITDIYLKGKAAEIMNKLLIGIKQKI